jgi:hypothetical protein
VLTIRDSPIYELVIRCVGSRYNYGPAALETEKQLYSDVNYWKSRGGVGPMMDSQVQSTLAKAQTMPDSYSISGQREATAVSGYGKHLVV